MYKKNIALVLSVVLIMALFSQYNRTDGFLHLLKNVNIFSAQQDASLSDSTVYAQVPENAREKFFIVYESTNIRTTFLSQKITTILDNQKKAYDLVTVNDFNTIPADCSGLIIAVENFELIPNMNTIRNYAQRGGSVVFTYRPSPGDNFNAIVNDLDIKTLNAPVNAPGIKLLTDFLFGGKGFKLDAEDFTISAFDVLLGNQARVHISSANNVPLLWESPVGNGKYIFYNGTNIYEKRFVGVLTAMFAATKSAYLYPVFGTKVFFIDDFPAPIPDGYFEKIYAEYQMKTEDFFKLVWWPEMLAQGQQHNFKYTGMIIENYNDKVEPPFTPLEGVPGGKARNSLIVFGRELLKANGELGIHGYNHQSLAPEGYGQEKLGYNIWANQENMILSLQELKRYIEEAFPGYEIRSYVPPSNVFSEMGREAAIKVFPQMKVFASLFTGGAEREKPYIQDFVRHEDGTYDIPRVSSGFIMSEAMKWDNISVINAQGIFSHFVHPDELFYEESAHLTWKQMREGFRDMMKTMSEKYSWLRPATASEATVYMDNYFDSVYGTVLENDVMTIYCENYQAMQVPYVLKTERKIKGFKGCSVKKIGDISYLVICIEPIATITFESEGAK